MTFKENITATADKIRSFKKMDNAERIKELEKEHEALKQKVRDFGNSIDDLYHQVGKVTAWSVGSDIVCDLCEELVKEKFKELKEMVK